ncbi:tyrosine-type recombinase/integrase [Streptomyces sioyaensis]|uniref:tyrosine-type recombinase/integrase n=1 Tax=Streptomyces sioyaensis TaxID=67364 RepID=UPI002699C14F|nr:site-specific integrase [Streptomyces sioyaensis]
MTATASRSTTTSYIPGVGAHRLAKLEPEHLERFYKKMQSNGSSAGTGHQAHRTVRAALNEAVRRRHITINPATVAKAPRLEEEEVEPYSVEEVQRILLEAERHRNTARWVIALALGLRQGEVLGLQWTDIDWEAGVIRVSRGRLRPRYKHGCGNRFGRRPGYCPQKINTRRETKDTKSRAGKRPIGVPEELMKLLREHKEEQGRERRIARDLWVEKGYVFISPTGEPLNPNTDHHKWKDLLKAAGIRDGRLHDARHTAGADLLILGVRTSSSTRSRAGSPASLHVCGGGTSTGPDGSCRTRPTGSAACCGGRDLPSKAIKGARLPVEAPSFATAVPPLRRVAAPEGLHRRSHYGAPLAVLHRGGACSWSRASLSCSRAWRNW